MVDWHCQSHYEGLFSGEMGTYLEGNQLWGCLIGNSQGQQAVEDGHVLDIPPNGGAFNSSKPEELETPRVNSRDIAGLPGGSAVYMTGVVLSENADSTLTSKIS